MTKKLIGHIEALVRFPLYEGDKIDRDAWNDFIYEEPGITAKGDLAVCRRECETLSNTLVLIEVKPE